METVLVIGAARSGIAVSKLLLKNGYHVILTDSNKVNEKSELESLGIEVYDEGHPDCLKEKICVYCKESWNPLSCSFRSLFCGTKRKNLYGN